MELNTPSGANTYSLGHRMRLKRIAKGAENTSYGKSE
jgi:hypothetical protein